MGRYYRVAKNLTEEMVSEILKEMLEIPEVERARVYGR